MQTQVDLFLNKAAFIIDSSSLIQLRQYYPKDLFAPLYDKLTPVLKSGKVVVLDLVIDEIKDKEKEIFKILDENIPKERSYKFEDYILESQKIIRTHYDEVKKPHKLKADPHIIACAKQENLRIVTDELKEDRTSIPNVCDKENVKYLNLLDFLREENISFKT